MNCVFCEIIAGRSPANFVCEWPDAIAFTPLNPVTEGHTLVVPKVHVNNAVENPFVTAQTMLCAAQIAGGVGQSNIITSVGPAATQSIFHLHIHIVPRRLGDGLKLPWTEQIDRTD